MDTEWKKTFTDCSEMEEWISKLKCKFSVPGKCARTLQRNDSFYQVNIASYRPKCWGCCFGCVHSRQSGFACGTTFRKSAVFCSRNWGTFFFFYTNQPVGYIKDVTSFYLFQWKGKYNLILEELWVIGVFIYSIIWHYFYLQLLVMVLIEL